MMTSTRSFVVTSASQSANLDAQGRSEISITVTNQAPKPARGEARPVPVGPTNATWLALAGEKERNFAPNESHQLTVRIQIPPGTTPGRYAFRLNVASVQNPDDDFTEGPEVAFEVKTQLVPKPAPGKFPFWILFVVLGLLVAGVLTWLVWPAPKLAVPEVRTKPFPEASNTLAAAQLTVVREVEVTRSNRVGVVFAQQPAAGAKVKKGAAVTLTVEGQPEAARVPDVVGMPISKVKDIFADKGFRYSTQGERITQQNPPAPGTILEQTPRGGELQDRDSAVALVIEASSVPVPNVSANLALNVAVNTLHASQLEPGDVGQSSVRDPALVSLVVNQEPKAGTRVKPGTKVQLFQGVLRTGPLVIPHAIRTNLIVAPPPLHAPFVRPK